MLYHIFLDASKSIYDPRNNLRPHVDGIVGSVNVKSIDLVTNHLKEFPLNQSTGRPTSSVSSNPTQSVDVHSVKLSTDPNGNQQLGGNKNKGHDNNRKGGKIIINPRTMIIMRRQIIMLESKRKRDVR
jgi:hypothetical protein